MDCLHKVFNTTTEKMNSVKYLNETILGVLVFAGVLFIGLLLIMLFERMKKRDEARVEKINREEKANFLDDLLDPHERMIS